MQRIASLCVCAAALLFVVPAAAQEGSTNENAAEAKAHFQLGVELAKQERWAEAERYFESSIRLYPRASTSYNRVLALHRLGRFRDLLEEAARFRALSGSGDHDAELRALSPIVERAESMLALVTVRTSPESARVQVDGTPLDNPGTELRLDPGRHQLDVSAAGFAPARLVVDVVAGERRTVSIALEAATASPPAPEIAAVPAASPARSEPPAADATVSRTIAPYLLLGAGGTALLAGGVTGVLALSLDGDLDGRCEGGTCPTSAADDQRRLEKLALATDLLLASGAITAASGAVWLLLRGSAESATVANRALRPYATTDGRSLWLSVAGRF